MRPMLLGFAAILALAAAPSHAIQSGEAVDPVQPFTLDRESGHLAGRLEAGTPVGDFVRAVGELAGIEVEIRGDPGRLNHSVSLDGLAIDTALKRVAPNQSLIISYVRRSVDDDAVPSAFADRAIRKIVFGSGTTVTVVPARAEAAQPADAPDPEVSRAILQREIVALSYAADRPAIELLREAALAPGDAETRIAAMSALAGVAGRENLALFTGSGLTDSDAGVRVEAARSIMRIMGENGRAIVETAARAESDPIVRETMQRLARGQSVERLAGRSREPATQ